MANQAVHWEEGMFLTPQHFQAADRHARRALGEVEEWHEPFPWGFRSLELDRGALAASQVRLTGCRARLKDGTHLRVGEEEGDDVAPLDLDLSEALNSAEQLDVYLAVPSFRLGAANVEATPTPRGPRFVIDEEDAADENTGRQPKPIRYRKLQARLLHSAEDRTGYEVLRLLRVVRGPAGGKPAIDDSAAPALLAVDAWPWLRDLVAGITREVRGRIRQLAELAVDREIGFRGQDPGDAERLLKLHALNEVEPPLAMLAGTPRIPPWVVYLELCRAVGRLALFLRERRAPELPAYDHDDPGPGFLRLVELIRLALEGAEPIRAIAVPLARTGQHLQAALQEGWIDLRRLYLGVETDLTADECDAVLKDRQVDRTIAGGNKVEGLYARRSRGLDLSPVTRPDSLPRKPSVPHLPNVVYFRIDGTNAEIWQGVVNDRAFAIRFNVTQSPFLDDEEVKVVYRSKDNRITKPGTLRFVLYVMPQR